MSLTSEQFDELMVRSFESAFSGVAAVAVGVSGGPDSMALLWFLQEWCAAQGKALHVLSVDHGLREEAGEECAMVAKYCAELSHVTHQTLVWDMPSAVRVQEEARKARYDLMRGYCDQHGIEHLFLGHHAGDQAETVLFRLAKGSGLDGLAGMRAVQDIEGLKLCRPLLSVEKVDLIEFCGEHEVPYVDDPSNEDESYARVRLRQSMDVLAAEGLTEKRLSVIASRMARARDALDSMADQVEEKYTIIKNTNRIEFDIDILRGHEEIVLRVVLKAIDEIGLDRDYRPRMEKVEALVHDLKNDVSFRKRTLGGVVFERDDAGGRLILTCENPA